MPAQAQYKRCALWHKKNADPYSIFRRSSSPTSSPTSMIITRAAAFRATCSVLSRLITFTSLKEMRRMLKATLVAAEAAEYRSRWEQHASKLPQRPTDLNEHWTTHADYLNCYLCLRLLPRDDFASTQLQGGRCLGHKSYAKRFCIDCGWRKKIWERGSVKGRGKRAIIVCIRCGGLNRSDPPQWFKYYRVCSTKCFRIHSACWIRFNAEWPVKNWIRHIESDSEWQRIKMREREESSKPERSPVTKATVIRMAHVLVTKTASTRRTRCQRCWAINHTQKLTWLLGSVLCKDCELVATIAKMGLKETDVDLS